MKFSNLVLALVLVLIPVVIGAPYYDDDEYYDDPELPDRKETMKKKQEQEQEQADLDSGLPSDSSSPSSTTTSKPSKPQKLSPGAYNPKKRWIHTKQVRGYHILSDGPIIETEFVKTRPMLRIRVVIPDTVRDVEKIIDRRNLELKIRNWNRVHKIHVKVPFGYEPDDLKVAEKKNFIDIMAPLYADVDEKDLDPYKNLPYAD